MERPIFHKSTKGHARNYRIYGVDMKAQCVTEHNMWATYWKGELNGEDTVSNTPFTYVIMFSKPLLYIELQGHF